jgi:hypothetical protein
LGFSQIDGSFTLWGGSFVGTPSGPSVDGDSKYYELTIDPSSSTVYLLWGGHLASPINWGVGKGASNYTGASLHMHIGLMPGDTSSQDRSIQTKAIVPLQGTITVYKEIVPSDSSLWDFSLSGPDSFSANANDLGDGDSYIFTDLVAGTYNLSEITNENYSTAVSCESEESGSDNVDITLDAGENVICTFTNTLQPATLHVVKVVANDNGGTLNADDFSFSINSETAIPFEADGQNDLTVDAGIYTVTEPPITGYSTTYDNCTNIDIPAGGEATCTITNDDVQPVLTVTKIVINDNNGDKQVSDFPLFVDQVSVTSGQQNGFDVGSYVVSETGQTGYSSVISGDCDGDGNVNLAVGDVKSCMITNDDIAPTLTLIKHVTNNNGGTKIVADFPLFINDDPVISGNANPLLANVLYTASETNLFGYAPSDWGGDCASDGTITLAPGDNKICDITNDDIQPLVTVTKYVLNNDGGNEVIASFALYVGTTQVLSGVQNGFDAWNYTIREINLDGYIASDWGGDCNADGTITLEVGEVYECSITNDDQPAHITLIKSVTNDNGGNAGVNDFGLTIGGTGVNSGDTLDVNSNTPIALNEAGLLGYSFVSITGDAKCPSELGETVTLNEGESVTCTITNDDDSPTITLNKNVNNDNGGNAGENDFGLTIGGTSVNSGETLGINANTPYALDEVGLAGYSFVSITGDAKCPGVLGGTVTLDEGEDVTCTITNDDTAASITLIKSVTNDNGGNAGVNDFGLTIGGTGVT